MAFDQTNGSQYTVIGDQISPKWPMAVKVTDMIKATLPGTGSPLKTKCTGSAYSMNAFAFDPQDSTFQAVTAPRSEYVPPLE